MTEKIIPLISSGTKGPLGVLHLPRLWLKTSLEAKGLLADGYPGAGQGFDQLVLDALELDRELFLNFIKEASPTYPQLEAWILKQKGGKLDPEAVSELNTAIENYLHKDEIREPILKAAGIPDNGKIQDAVNLNNLDDWQEFHAAVLK